MILVTGAAGYIGSHICKKLEKAKLTKISDDFLIIARIESFILGKSLNDAINRA